MTEVAVVPEAAERKYAETVGARLREVRRQKRLSLQAVEATSHEEFKASVLGAYERGERAISVPRLRRLAAIYDVPLDQLLPHGADEHTAEAAHGTSRISSSQKIRIDLVRLKQSPGPESEALLRFLTKIQLERQDFNGQVLTIRAEDIRVIGATFGLSLDEMISHLGELGLLYA
ncbi:MAG: transcriptional regulator [Acidimicrobiales bacterium]